MDSSDSVYKELAKAEMEINFPNVEKDSEPYNELLRHAVRSHELAVPPFDSSAFQICCNGTIQCLVHYSKIFQALDAISDDNTVCVETIIEESINKMAAMVKLYQGVSHLALVEIVNECYGGNSLRTSSYVGDEYCNVVVRVDGKSRVFDTCFELTEAVVLLLEEKWEKSKKLATKGLAPYLSPDDRFPLEPDEYTTWEKKHSYANNENAGALHLVALTGDEFPEVKRLLAGCNRELFETRHAMQQRENATKETPPDDNPSGDKKQKISGSKGRPRPTPKTMKKDKAIYESKQKVGINEAAKAHGIEIEAAGKAAERHRSRIRKQQ